MAVCNVPKISDAFVINADVFNNVFAAEQEYPSAIPFN